MSERVIALHYLGGAYIHGVPARDLTLDEAMEYGDTIKEQETLTGVLLYDPVVKPAQAAKPAKATKEPE